MWASGIDKLLFPYIYSSTYYVEQAIHGKSLPQFFFVAILSKDPGVWSKAKKKKIDKAFEEYMTWEGDRRLKKKKSCYFSFDRWKYTKNGKDLK